MGAQSTKLSSSGSSAPATTASVPPSPTPNSAMRSVLRPIAKLGRSCPDALDPGRSSTGGVRRGRRISGPIVVKTEARKAGFGQPLREMAVGPVDAHGLVTERITEEHRLRPRQGSHRRVVQTRQRTVARTENDRDTAWDRVLDNTLARPHPMIPRPRGLRRILVGHRHFSEQGRDRLPALPREW